MMVEVETLMDYEDLQTKVYTDLPMVEMIQLLTEHWGAPTYKEGSFVGNEHWRICAITTQNDREYVTGVVFLSEPARVWGLLRWA